MNSRSVTPFSGLSLVSSYSSVSSTRLAVAVLGRRERSGCRPGAPRRPACAKRGRRGRRLHLLGHPAAAARGRSPRPPSRPRRASPALCSSTRWKPSTNPDQRRGSRHSRRRRLGAERHLAGGADRRGISRRPRARSRRSSAAPSPGTAAPPRAGACTPCAPAFGERVEAPRAPLGVLPLALDQPVLLEPAQQRVHRVRVHRQHALGHARRSAPSAGCRTTGPRRSGGAPAAAAPGGGASRR